MSNLSLVKTSNDIVKYKADKVIFIEGQLLKDLYILKKGEIIFTKTHGQHLSVIKLCGEKEILNEVSMLTDKPVEFSAIAKTDVELVLVEQKEILSVVRAGPAWIFEIFETLCERLKSTQNIIEENHLLNGEKSSNMILSKEDEKRYVDALINYREQ